MRGDASRPRVVLVTNLFPTPSEPERGIFILHVARRLTDYCDLTVVCPLPWFPSIHALRRFKRWYRFAEVPGAYLQDGVRVIAPKYPLLPKLSEPLHARLMAGPLRRALSQLMDSDRIDLLHSHWLYPDSVAVHFANEALRIPHVATGRGCDVNEYPRDRTKGPQIMAMLHAAAAVTVVSERLREKLIERGLSADRITTIPNGVDTTLFAPRSKEDARKGLGLDVRAKYILYVGRFSEEKGVETLVDAFAGLRQSREGIRLLLVGGGPLQASLEKRVKALALSDDVLFAGPQGHRNVAFWMNAADCLCLPSVREGHPNVVLEALASGLPVVASRVSTIPEMITPRSGVVVSAGRPLELADALNAVLSRKWEPSDVAASVKLQSWEDVASRYWSVYRSVLNQDMPFGVSNSPLDTR